MPPTAQTVCFIPFDRQDDRGLPAWADSLPARSTVCATLGTAYNRAPGMFAAMLDGLRDEPINLIATIGNLDPADLGTQPENVQIERYVPQSLLFPRCDLVITHGGFCTVMTALDHGLPLVVIPIAADQPDNARRCADLGLGRIIAPNQRTPQAIRDAARDVLRAPTYRRNAERMQSDMHALPDVAHAVALLERLAAERRPLHCDH